MGTSFFGCAAPSWQDLFFAVGSWLSRPSPDRFQPERRRPSSSTSPRRAPGARARTKASACNSISQAVNVAAADTGDNVIIKVAAGTYDGSDSIDASALQSLSIVGAVPRTPS